MSRFRLRTDLQRVVLGDFALAMGIDPADKMPPVQGYTLAYNVGEEEDPDTYLFSVVVSWERLAAVVRWAFGLLPGEVAPILEIDSYDAYRAIDVYIGDAYAPVTGDLFREIWATYEELLLEEGAIGIGANAEDPFIEVFLDQWKAISIHVPMSMRDDIEAGLIGFGLEEVPETWPETDGDKGEMTTIRQVLDLSDPNAFSLDDVLLDLRQHWQLVLNIDSGKNLDDGERELGHTLWHVVVIVEDDSGDDPKGAYVSVWVTAKSLDSVDSIVQDVIVELSDWSYVDTYSCNRVAFDERPDDLADLPPRSHEEAVHLVQVEPWKDQPDG